MDSELEKECLYLNITLIELLAKQFSISTEEFIDVIKFVAHNDKVFNMAKQLHPALKANPNLEVNFGDYGQNVAKECNVEPEYLFKALIYVAHNELVFNVAQQLMAIYKNYKDDDNKELKEVNEKASD